MTTRPAARQDVTFVRICEKLSEGIYRAAGEMGGAVSRFPAFLRFPAKCQARSFAVLSCHLTRDLSLDCRDPVISLWWSVQILPALLR